MGIFGWSYPPGCSGPPDDEPWNCEVCGAPSEELCICPICEMCQAVGEPNCYKPYIAGGHEMEETKEQVMQLAWFEAHAENIAFDEAHADYSFLDGHIDEEEK